RRRVPDEPRAAGRAARRRFGRCARGAPPVGQPPRRADDRRPCRVRDRSGAARRMSDACLETPRLRLHPFARRDVDALHAQWLDPDVRRHLWDGRVIARDEVVAVVNESIASFATRRFGLWTIEAGSTPIGFAGLRRIPESDDVELYYGLARSS